MVTRSRGGRERLSDASTPFFAKPSVWHTLESRITLTSTEIYKARSSARGWNLEPVGDSLPSGKPRIDTIRHAALAG